MGDCSWLALVAAGVMVVTEVWVVVEVMVVASEVMAVVHYELEGLVVASEVMVAAQEVMVVVHYELEGLVVEQEAHPEFFRISHSEYSTLLSSYHRLQGRSLR
jgi:hypothetical protein